MEEQVLVPDPNWIVEDTSQYPPHRQRKCRGYRCKNVGVAYRFRPHRYGRNRKSLVRYYYCADHLYGGKVKDGRVWIPVHPDSPMARAYAEAPDA